MNAAALQARRHDPPLDWTPETFERLTDALAAVFVAAARRRQREDERERRPGPRRPPA